MSFLRIIQTFRVNKTNENSKKLWFYVWHWILSHIWKSCYKSLIYRKISQMAIVNLCLTVVLLTTWPVFIRETGRRLLVLVDKIFLDKTYIGRPTNGNLIYVFIFVADVAVWELVLLLYIYIMIETFSKNRTKSFQLIIMFQATGTAAVAMPLMFPCSLRPPLVQPLRSAKTFKPLSCLNLKGERYIVDPYFFNFIFASLVKLAT